MCCLSLNYTHQVIYIFIYSYLFVDNCKNELDIIKNQFDQKYQIIAIFFIENDFPKELCILIKGLRY